MLCRHGVNGVFDYGEKPFVPSDSGDRSLVEVSGSKVVGKRVPESMGWVTSGLCCHSACLSGEPEEIG